jgi:hypothetical protein
MKQVMVLMGLCWVMAAQAQSIDPVSMVIAKAIKAIDLKVQKLQNETLVLQGVQQMAEQELGKQQLAEIRNWQVQLSQLYTGYYAELKQVKSVFTVGAVVRKILSLQKEVIVEYSRLGSIRVVPSCKVWRSFYPMAYRCVMQKGFGCFIYSKILCCIVWMPYVQ